MRTRVVTAAALLLAAATLTACSGGDSKPTAKPAKKAAGKASSKTTASPPSPEAPFAIGKKWQWDEGTAQGYTTVLGYEQPLQLPIPPETKGYVWATLEVKVCNEQGKQVPVSQAPWSLAYEDGAREAPPGLAGPGLPKPELPVVDAIVKAGDCIRGKIPFEVPGDQRPERVVYAPGGLSETAEWAVPKG